jgi:prepilin-type N-terminal cleavage/methylation domain-containing protein
MLAILFGNKKGFSVIEIIIVIAIISVGLINLLGVGAFSLKISSVVKQTSIADSLAKESIEVVRNIRDITSWDADGIGILNTGAVFYHPELNTGVNPPVWTLVLGEETINNYTRRIDFDRVSRNPTTGDIESVYNSSNDDPNTRKIITTVLWGAREVELITYITNWK